IDLWLYAQDQETSDSLLTYTITGNTAPSCGASIDASGFFDINPASNWTGSSNVTIRVTDAGGLWSEDSLTVIGGHRAAACADARNLQDGSWVVTDAKTVTARFPAVFYIENQSRASGI